MTHTNLIIRKATFDDSGEIEKIEKACFSTPWSLNSIEESLKNECSVFYLAELDSQVVGYMGLQIFSGEGYVTNIGVLPEYRKMGIATALIEAQMQNEMDFITLEVRQSNVPAISLYNKLGFEDVGVRKNYYSNPTENAVLMTKYFN